MKRRLSWLALQARKQSEPMPTVPWGVLTAYDATTAKLLETAGIEVILVGDSLAMTALGYPDTLSVTLDEMLHHTKAVRRGAPKVSLLADAPFMTYTVSVEATLRNLSRFISEGGADAVKVEGASSIVVEGIKRLSECGIPVVGHVGLTPQHSRLLGGFKKQGKTEATAAVILEQAKAVEAAGSVAVVLESVPPPLAEAITAALRVPTIGIGCGSACNAQVLVTDDLLGRFLDFKPSFVKPALNMGQLTVQAVQAFVANPLAFIQ